ncbi:MAG: Trk system potassium transporter TrkA [bacterium]
MRIIVIGAGEVGFYIAQRLTAENHDVIVIERDEERRQLVQNQLDVLTVAGNGASARILKEAGIEKADLVIAATSIDEVNIIACMLAAQFGVSKKIARVRNPEYTSSSAVLDPKKLGIDLMIHPEEEAVSEIARLLKRSGASEIIEFADGRIQLIGLRIDRNAPVIHRSMAEVSASFPELTFRAVVIYRGDQTIIPRGENRFRQGDQIFVIAKREAIPLVEKMAGKSENRLEKVMILGGGRIGRGVANVLEKEKLTVKLIESDRDRSDEIANSLPRTLVLRGDDLDVDLLAREGIVDMDALVAVTDDEGINVISCLLAKHLKVKKTIALIRRPYYLPLMPSIGIDAAVSPRISTASAILRFVRRARVVCVAALKGCDAEAMELVAMPGSKIVGQPLKRVNFPKEAIVGAIIGRGKVIVPTGESMINANDEVVVFAKPEAISQVERFFT